MLRYIWIGILSIGFLLNWGDAFAQKPQKSKGHCFIVAMKVYSVVKIGNDKQLSFFTEEIDYGKYRFFVYMTKQTYGDTSEQYKFVLPDTAKFRELYGFPFFERRSNFTRRATKLYLIKEVSFPMIAISYEQALAFCQWYGTTLMGNSTKSKFVYTYSLPTQADYEAVLDKAKITQKKALSPLQRKRSKRVLGLTDNVAEYTQEGTVVEGGENTVLKFIAAKDCETPTGFRLKATAVSKNK